MELIIKTTNRCNFGCVYCSVGKPEAQKDLPLATLFKAIDELPALLAHLGQREVSLIWHGGEPLLHSTAYFQQAMDYAVAKLADYKVRFKLQTNGYLINDQWIELFKNYNVAVGISLDGPSSIHNQTRVLKDGTGTHGQVMGNINSMRQANVPVSVLMVVNNYLLGREKEVFQFLESCQLHCKINPMLNCGNATENSRLMEYDYAEFMQNIYRQWVKTEQVIEIEPLASVLSAVLTGGTLTECSYSGSCGSNFMCLDMDGTIYPCGRFSDIKEFAYGSINDKSLLDLYLSPVADKLRCRSAAPAVEQCARCDYYSLCRGGCAFDAYNSANTINAPASMCAAHQQLIYYINTEGLQLFKQRLINEKKRLQQTITDKQQQLKELNDYAL